MIKIFFIIFYDLDVAPLLYCFIIRGDSVRKFLRKFSAVIMSLLLCLTMLAVGITAGASNTAELRVSSASAKAGEQVRVDIKAVGFSKAAGIQLKVDFGNELTFVSKQSNYINLDDNNSAVKDGVFSLAVYGEQSESDPTKLDSIIATDMEESLLTLVFEIPSNAAENQIYDIMFIASDTRASDTDEKLIPLKLTNGKVTVESEEKMKVELINTDDRQVVDTQYFDSNIGDYSYTFDSAVSGSYILSASRPKYVTREYTVTDGKQIQQSVEIFHPGDVNLDGKVNYADIQRLYQHISTGQKLIGYALLISDVNNDEKVNYADIQRIYQHISTNNKLF